MLNGVDSALLTSAPWLLLWGFLAVAAAWDLHHRRIPNVIPLSLACVGLAVNVWLRPLTAALFVSVGGLLVGFLLWLPPYLLRFAGAADLKLAAAVGVWLGPLGALRVSIYAALIGGVLALLWLLRSQGFLGSWVFLRMVPHWAPRVVARRSSALNVSVPYALAIAVGVALELVSGPLLGGPR